MLALGAFFVGAMVLAACGSDVPGNSVAQVGDQPITKEQFDHWLPIIARSSQQGTATVPDPPSYRRCIAAKRKAQPKPAKGQKAPTDAALRQQCEQQYKTVRSQTMNYLIQARWLEGEAQAQGVKVSDAEVRKRFEQEKKRTFPKESAYRAYLKQTGQTEADILFSFRLNLVSNRLRDKVIKGKAKVTDAEVARYYNSHKGQFAQPEKRDVLIVLTRTKARAEQARKALSSGQSWKAVVKRYSIDQQTQATGGLLAGVVRGQQDQALDKATFAASKGKLIGPLKAQFGWYVIKVTRITPRSQQSLAAARTSIRQQLSSQRQQAALNAFVKDFRKRWTDRTNCRGGYVVQGCKGAPTPTTSGATTQS